MLSYALNKFAFDKQNHTIEQKDYGVFRTDFDIKLIDTLLCGNIMEQMCESKLRSLKPKLK